MQYIDLDKADAGRITVSIYIVLLSLQGDSTMSSNEEDYNEAEGFSVHESKKRRIQRACDTCRRKKSEHHPAVQPYVVLTVTVISSMSGYILCVDGVVCTHL